MRAPAELAGRDGPRTARDHLRVTHAGPPPPAAACTGTRDLDGSLLVRLRIPAERGDGFLAAIQAALDSAEPDSATGAGQAVDAGAAGGVG